MTTPIEPNKSHTIRIGQVTSVNTQRGTLDLKWLDHRGGRKEVPFTLSDWGVYAPPPINAILLLITDHQDQTRILRTIPLGYQVHTASTYTLPESARIPEVLPGEKLFYSAGGLGASQEEGGAILHLTNTGDIHLRTYFGANLIVYRDAQLIHLDSLSQLLDSLAGRLYWGPTERLLVSEGGTGSLQRVTKDGKTRTELRLTVNETSDGITGASNLQDPLFEIVLGSKVDASGEVIQSEAGEEIAYEMQLLKQGTPQITLQWDKAGNSFLLQTGSSNVTIQGDVNLTVTGDVNADITGALTGTIQGDTNIVSGGVSVIEGSKVQLTGNSGSINQSPVVRFSDLQIVFSLLSDLANLLITHTHTGVTTGPGLSGPADPPTQAQVPLKVTDTSTKLSTAESQVAVQASGQ